MALEAETAITLLSSSERDVYRKLVADRIGKLQQQNPSHEPHPEIKLIKSIQAKPQENNATITWADKGNSIVILPNNHYENKIEKFISDNFHTFFYVSLTVRLCIFILAVNQLDAQTLFYNKFISCLYMFRAPCAHQQEVKITLYSMK